MRLLPSRLFSDRISRPGVPSRYSRVPARPKVIPWGASVAKNTALGMDVRPSSSSKRRTDPLTGCDTPEFEVPKSSPQAPMADQSFARDPRDRVRALVVVAGRLSRGWAAASKTSTMVGARKLDHRPHRWTNLRGQGG